ncbi:MAG: uroporphyrinogen decarboxylase family protein [Coriobacteriales bacterium]|nr:uroporphyrinogen decarboxylase family protein [Coriobacteriales bacterium]
MLDRIDFDESELEVKGEYRGRFGSPDNYRLNYPIPAGENLMAMYRGEKPLWIPRTMDIKPFGPRVLPENKVRGFVMEANRMSPEEYGGPDPFGVQWIFEPQVGGSMVRPGSPKVTDLDEWFDQIDHPDPDTWDWEGSAASNKEFFEKNYADEMPRVTLFTGFFERLISWIDFEDAAVAMIDEEDEENVHAIFEYLADFYIKEIRKVHEYFPGVQMVQLHDDWGSQAAPFFPLSVVEEMIVPHMKKVADATHELGMIFDQHSCGFNRALAPAMVEIGVDSWQPQRINDSWAINEDVGKDMVIYCVPENTPKGLSPEEYDDMAHRWVDEHIETFLERPFIFHPAPSDPTQKTYVDREFVRGVYKWSRIALNEA